MFQLVMTLDGLCRQLVLSTSQKQLWASLDTDEIPFENAQDLKNQSWIRFRTTQRFLDGLYEYFSSKFLGTPNVE